MNKKVIINACLLSLLGVSGASYAAKSQDCDNSIILLVADKLKLKGISEPEQSDSSYSSNKLDGISSAACKVNPQNKELMYVALASNPKESNYGELTHDFTIAVVNIKKNTLVSSYKDHLEEDATLRVQDGTLWIDTANYKLNETTRAFGIEIRSGYIPNCGGGGIGPIRSLYIQDGKKIRPILSNIIMSDWTYLIEGLSRCNSIGNESDITIVENHQITISIGDTKTNGFNDILLNKTKTFSYDAETPISKDDKEANSIIAKNSTFKPYSLKLTYDGNKYPYQN